MFEFFRPKHTFVPESPVTLFSPGEVAPTEINPHVTTLEEYEATHPDKSPQVLLAQLEQLGRGEKHFDIIATQKYLEQQSLKKRLATLAPGDKMLPKIQHRINFLQDWLNTMQGEGHVPVTEETHMMAVHEQIRQLEEIDPTFLTRREQINLAFLKDYCEGEQIALSVETWINK
jgi:hypothetical protein